MGHFTLWQACHDEETRDSCWCRVEQFEFLVPLGDLWMIKLPPGHGGLVNGLAIVGGFQVVEPGALVRVWDSTGNETELLVRCTSAQVVDGTGRPCRLCGDVITGDTLLCSCGASYCGDADTLLDHCPDCGAAFKFDGDPSEQLL